MIKALGKSGDRPMLLFGLSRKNCELLLEGKPIKIDLQQMLEEAIKRHDLNDAVVILMAGETEESITEELSKHTKLPPVEDRLKHNDDEQQFHGRNS